MVLLSTTEMVVTLVLLILGTLVGLYLFSTENYKYWQKRGVPCADGVVPGVGHLWEFFIMKSSISDCYRKIYDANRTRSMVGFYNFMSPKLMVREPKLVKTVLQTSFANFHENGIKIDPELDPILSNNPFFTYGDKWVAGRKRLTYAFSSMRLKILLESVKQECEKFESYLDKKISKVGKAELELKNLFARFTSQVVCNAGFGVDELCFDEERENKSFYTKGTFCLEPIWNTINFFIFFVSLNKILGARFLSKKADRFFRTIIADFMEQRRKESTRRNDFLQLMADLERMEDNKFDLEMITSHAVSFFVNGYETSSTVLGFIGFHLAKHPKVQEKLREEVMSVLNKYDGVITYDALKDMTYMDQVMSESQRALPTLGYLDKVCTEETELKGSDGLVCRVQRGTHILIPISGLQEDPQYWENPKVFDPERFSPKRKHRIERFAFLPFGEGPRICVGMRMAQLLIKACLATLLRKYSLELSSKTRLPLKMEPTATFLFAVEGGLWAIIRPI